MKQCITDIKSLTCDDQSSSETFKEYFKNIKYVNLNVFFIHFNKLIFFLIFFSKVNTQIELYHFDNKIETKDRKRFSRSSSI